MEAKDKYARGQGQGPRTQAQLSVLKKKFFFFKKHFTGDFKKKNLQKFFSGDLQPRKARKVLENFPRGFWRFPTKF